MGAYHVESRPAHKFGSSLHAMSSLRNYGEGHTSMKKRGLKCKRALTSISGSLGMGWNEMKKMTKVTFTYYSFGTFLLYEVSTSNSLDIDNTFFIPLAPRFNEGT